MERHEIDALLSTGIAAERAGRMEDAKALAETLIHALRVARLQRETGGDGARVADQEAMNWAMSAILRAASPRRT